MSIMFYLGHTIKMLPQIGRLVPFEAFSFLFVGVSVRISLLALGLQAVSIAFELLVYFVGGGGEARQISESHISFTSFS